MRTWSGGMERRLAIAMGLVHRPQVPFLDEPTTGFDPDIRAGMWAAIRRLGALLVLAVGSTLLPTRSFRACQRSV